MNHFNHYEVKDGTIECSDQLSMNDIHKLENNAKLSALRHVSAMLQRPDQLEKLDVFKKRSARKKEAVAAMLKTGVQSQLEGVRSGIGLLQSAAEDIKTVGENLQEIVEFVDGFPALKEKLNRLREENIKHSQYATAMENLKHIFNVPETIEKTHDLIMDGKLLLAHKSLMELETARDDLLYEVHKLKSDSEYDKNMLKSYFSEIEKLADELGKQIWYIVSRTLEAVRGTDPGPQQVVTALRIIEREQRIDNYYEEGQLSLNGFMPPGRPRNWRERCFHVLEKTVVQRITGNQLEDRSVNDKWLLRHLEVCFRIVIDDIKVARSGAVACFPPEYHIYDRFVAMYHSCISNRLREIASQELYKNEIAHLLSWIQAYSGEEMLGNRRLQINVHALLNDHPLLPKSTITHLSDRFVELVRKDASEWLDKALQQEKDDWYKDVHAEEDSNHHYYTALPGIFFQMIDQQISVSRAISTDIIPNVIAVHVEQFLNSASKYKDAAMAYKNKNFEDRSRFKLYTSTMIAIANNFDTFLDETDKIKKQVRLTMEGRDVQQRLTSVNRQQLLENIDMLRHRWTVGCQAAVGSLLEEIYQDLAPFFADLLTKKWLTTNQGQVRSSQLETICQTLVEYNTEDHKRLRPHIMASLLMEFQYRTIGEYLKAIENRRISFPNYEERSSAAKRIIAEAEYLRDTFHKLLYNLDVEFQDLTGVLPAMAEVLSLRDRSLLALEVSGLVRKYPDIGVELVSGLVQLREDIGRSEAKNLAVEILQQNKYHPKGNQVFVTLFQANAKSDEKRLHFDLSSNVFATLSLKRS